MNILMSQCEALILNGSCLISGKNISHYFFTKNDASMYIFYLFLSTCATMFHNMPIHLPTAARITSVQPANANTVLMHFDVSLGAKPGQFVNVWIPGVDEKPYSVANDDGHSTTLAVSAVGPFSKKLAAMQVGQRVGLRGAFGTTFSPQMAKQHAVLVGGGFGAAPLCFLGKALKQRGVRVTLIIGARTADLLLFGEYGWQLGFEVLETTDDGSAGQQGRVTDALGPLLQSGGVDAVYTCGPEMMMVAVAKLAAAAGAGCEVSVERYMKCGFGVCGQCACGDKISCIEGPVMAAEQAFGTGEFGRFYRSAEGRRVAYS